MAVLNSVQLPDGTVYDLQDAVGNYATQTYVDNAVAGITKGTLGLGNVDNTSDLNKPVSTAQQTALNAKANNTLIAKVETSTTATQRYEIGDQFILNGVLYKATSIIANGGTITIGTNCTAADTIVKQISDNNGKKKYLLISDSYGGYTYNGITYSWIDDVIENTGINATKLSVGSIGFRPPHDLVSSFQEILENAIENETLGNLSEYTDIIVGGGANDITSVNLGAITKAQLIGYIEDFVELCTANFPNAKVYVGMIGNVKSSNFARAYYTVLEAYRDCRSVGASYLENVEYILGAEYIKESDGIHPTPEGFVELKNYMSEAVINKSCVVNRAIQKMTGKNANDTTNVGAWNLVPDLWISINNGRQTMQFKRYGLGLTFVAANRLTFDSLVTEISYESYKLLALTELTIGHIKGGAYVTDHYEPYFCGKAHIKLSTTTLVDVFLDVPIAVVLGKLYLCLPSSVALAQAMYGNITGIDGSFLYCYLLSAVFDIDGSNYNGTLAN